MKLCSLTERRYFLYLGVVLGVELRAPYWLSHTLLFEPHLQYSNNRKVTKLIVLNQKQKTTEK
jgi:hypothetical protein